jgi:hypothetical protein
MADTDAGQSQDPYFSDDLQQQWLLQEYPNYWLLTGFIISSAA